LETTAKLLKSLERVLAVFSKGGLKSFNNQGDFDSAALIDQTDGSPRQNGLARSSRLALDWSLIEHTTAARSAEDPVTMPEGCPADAG
jgi:hypothetical protein